MKINGQRLIDPKEFLQFYNSVFQLRIRKCSSDNTFLTTYILRAVLSLHEVKIEKTFILSNTGKLFRKSRSRMGYSCSYSNLKFIMFDKIHKKKKIRNMKNYCFIL